MAHFEFVGKDHTKRVCSCILDKCSFGCALRRTFENKLTNADRIRSMTDEELAQLFMDSYGYAPWCDTDSESWCENDSCKPCCEKWLKSPANAEVSE